MNGAVAADPRAAPDGTIRSGLRSAARWTKRLGEESQKQHELLLGALERLDVDMRASEALWRGAREREAQEIEELRARREHLTAENDQIARASVELEEHTTRLASLYTAIFQLHASLELPTVLRSVCEVVLNLIGAESFVLRLAEEPGFVEVARDADLLEDGPRLVEPERALERRALAERRTLLAGADAPADEPLSATPLIFQGTCVGLLSVHRLLSHKNQLSALDRELFDLLGEQAASAIVSARTFSAADRKLKTAKGFLSLLGTSG